MSSRINEAGHRLIDELEKQLAANDETICGMKKALESARCCVAELRNNAIRAGSAHGDIDERLTLIDKALAGKE